jgi:hypothetical protein
MSLSRILCLTVFLGMSQTSISANLLDAREMAYQQKLDHAMQRIEQTKLILDDTEITATPLEQQKALCDRLNAYREIILLAEEFDQVEQAHAMKRVAQFYLNQQSEQFDQSGITLETWCKS